MSEDRQLTRAELIRVTNWLGGALRLIGEAFQKLGDNIGGLTEGDLAELYRQGTMTRNEVEGDKPCG